MFVKNKPTHGGPRRCGVRSVGAGRDVEATQRPTQSSTVCFIRHAWQREGAAWSGSDVERSELFCETVPTYVTPRRQLSVAGNKLQSLRASVRTATAVIPASTAFFAKQRASEVVFTAGRCTNRLSGVLL